MTLGVVIALIYPVLVYFGLQQFSPLTVVGLLIAFLIIRLAFVYKTGKTRYEFYSLGFALLMVLALVNLDGEMALKSYPVAICLSLACLFSYSLARPPSVIARFARMVEPNLNDRGVAYTNNVTKVWICFFIINGLISAWTALYASLEVWTLYNGLISYSLMGLIFVGEFAIRQKVKKHHVGGATFQPLSCLMTSGRDESIPVAIYPDRVLTFGDYKSDVASNARWLEQAGNRKIALFFQDSYNFAVGVMAGLQAGCDILLPANGQPETLKNLEDHGYLIVGDDGLISGEGRFDFVLLSNKESRIDFMTSGSSGQPKVITKQISQIENEIAVLEKTWGQTIAGTQTLATVSHQHIYGFLFKVMWPLAAGRPFVVETFEYWERLVPLMTRRTSLISSPAHLTRFPVLDLPKDYQAPEMVFSSGGTLPFKAAAACQKVLGRLPTDIVGSTETGGIGYRQQDKDGMPFSAFDGIEITKDDDGLMKIRSPYLADDDWYETKDRVELLANGMFRLQGRADKIVKVEGKRVSLHQVQDHLLTLDWVEDAVVFILDDERKSLAAVVVLTDAGQQALQERGAFRVSRTLRKELSARQEQAGLPRRWRFVDEIPTNAQGKRPLGDLARLFD